MTLLLVRTLPADSPALDADRESLPPGAALAALTVHPAEIRLDGRYAYAQVLVTAKLESGEALDATRLVSIERPGAAGSELVEVSPSGLVRGRKDGGGELKFTLAGRSAAIPVTVSGLDAPSKVSFVQDVMPVLSKVGCTAGTCHGSQKGQNGFKLSLRGYDAEFDYQALTDDMEGRRFNRAAPDRSLFLMKISGAAPHVGGVLTHAGEPYYEILRSWVAGGVELDLDAPRVVKLEVVPAEVLMPMPGMKQQMKVLATYASGRVRDVTAEAIIDTSNTEVTRVDRKGLVTAVRRGEAAILARYEGRYTAATLFVMGERNGFQWQDVPEYNYADSLVYKKLRKIKTLPSEVAADDEFVRRVNLDLTGLQPRPKEVRVFLGDSRDSRKKREELVDRLIGSAEFVEHWTNKWSDLLQVNSKWLGVDGATGFRAWIQKAVASNMPYDRYAKDVLNSSGSTMANPPTAYYKILRKPQDAMENTTQLFLGVRFNCNQCHDHPFERWTQGNYWELAAFFAQIERQDAPGSAKMPQLEIVEGAPPPPAYEELISDKTSGELKNAKGVTVLASFPFKHTGQVPDQGALRERLSAWVTSPENPYFAKSFVNRLWSYFLGIGFIDPVDDIRAGNPPTNPELLDRLTADFIASGFDVRKLMRFIVTSRTYQHSIRTNEWNEDDSANFSHALARRLPAETLYDAVHQATGSVTRLPGVLRGTRAAELLDPSIRPGDGFLEIFGRPPRESACECERSSGMSLGQALSLVNGPTVAEAVRDPQNALADLVAVETNPRRILDEIFLNFLCRFPTAKEVSEFAGALDPRNADNVSSLPPDKRQELDARFLAWEKSQVIPSWVVLEPGIVKSAGGAKFAVQPDLSALATGSAPETDTYTFVAWTDLEKITAIRIEALPDPTLGKANGPGRSDNGNFVLSELRVAAASVPDPAMAKGVALQNATADFAQEGLPAGTAIDGNLEKGWAILPRTGKAHTLIVETKEDVGGPGVSLLTLTVEQQFGTKHTIGRLRVSVTATPRPIRFGQLPEDIAQIILTAREKRTAEQRNALVAYYLGTDAEMAHQVRLANAQDIAWALANSPAFLFNR